MVKYDANWEIMNTYENLQIVQSQFLPISWYSFIFGLIWISIGLSVFRFIAYEYKWRAIWSAIRWAIMKVILNYLPLPNDISSVVGVLQF